MRGYRIELGEIETALEVLSAVESAVVDSHKTTAGNILVAYVVMNEEGEEEEGGDLNDLEEVAAWGEIYDQAYSSGNAIQEDPKLNYSGYDNTYTPGLVHKPDVVAEWVHTTVDRVMAEAPKTVIEMGCGNGMIMLHCLPSVTAFYAADLSGEALGYIGDVMKRSDYSPEAHKLKLMKCGAHEFKLWASESGTDVDLVVVNGVSMYFPSLGYLKQVSGVASSSGRQLRLRLLRLLVPLMGGAADDDAAADGWCC